MEDRNKIQKIISVWCEDLDYTDSECLTDKILDFAKEYHTEQLALCSVVGQSEQLTFKCDLCQDDGVMIAGMDCTCKAAPSKS